ncbi:oxidoreductase, short chain dehydrogenase/reductase family protein [Dictyocaulus viviparus]|uniref:Oxidoreductase, short chain dehydrogenase/reductase family protein n=1 Tax=Dictyocaulus viviparus TaxID=29172 RepID=A0A0D8XGA5_DICVI|nr:oxidoreductase, short chain dehydrogenase/reductase family protein [Dictyocaulus viviparus]
MITRFIYFIFRCSKFLNFLALFLLVSSAILSLFDKGLDPKTLLYLPSSTDLFKKIDGQLVVITGGASGLGKCIAEILSVEKGARLVILDINIQGAEETVASIIKNGGQAYAYHCDIRSEESLQRISKIISEKHGYSKASGSVDIVVCNAAVLSLALFKELTVAELRQSLEVNVLGTINTIRAFLTQMEERNSGQIVAVSSIAGFSGETFGLAYCPTKFAVRGVMECLQMELRDRGLEGIVCTTVIR